jgi:hypothetical protein
MLFLRWSNTIEMMLLVYCIYLSEYSVKGHRNSKTKAKRGKGKTENTQVEKKKR